MLKLQIVFSSSLAESQLRILKPITSGSKSISFILGVRDNVDVNATGLFYVIAVGQGTIIAASGKARFGNSATTSNGGWVGWTNLSDGRFKKNVKDNVPGLDFIIKLRPVTYNMDAPGLDAFLHKNDSRETKALAAENSLHINALREKDQLLMPVLLHMT